MKTKRAKIFVAFCVILFVFIFYTTGLYKHLTLTSIQYHLNELKLFSINSPGIFLAIFSAIYILLTSLSIPGTIVLTFLAGAIFGLVKGTFIVSFCATIGAGISFLLSRYLFRDYVMNKFRRRFYVMDAKFRKNGTLYLLTLRLIPISPFVCVNVLMGLTTVKFSTFSIITFLGMFPGTSIYVFAGKEISRIENPMEIFTGPVILALFLVSFLPWIGKWILSLIKTKEFDAKKT